jgi:hypothetical protein
MSKEIDDLQKMFPAGSEFPYLDVKMSVIGHFIYTTYEIIPKLTCHYVNKQGEIKEIEFNYDVAKKIKEQHESA